MEEQLAPSAQSPPTITLSDLSSSPAVTTSRPSSITFVEPTPPTGSIVLHPRGRLRTDEEKNTVLLIDNPPPELLEEQKEALVRIRLNEISSGTVADFKVIEEQKRLLEIINQVMVTTPPDKLVDEQRRALMAVRIEDGQRNTPSTIGHPNSTVGPLQTPSGSERGRSGEPVLWQCIQDNPGPSPPMALRRPYLAKKPADRRRLRPQTSPELSRQYDPSSSGKSLDRRQEDAKINALRIASAILSTGSKYPEAKVKQAFQSYLNRCYIAFYYTDQLMNWSDIPWPVLEPETIVEPASLTITLVGSFILSPFHSHGHDRRQRIEEELGVWRDVAIVTAGNDRQNVKDGVAIVVAILEELQIMDVSGAFATLFVIQNSAR